MAPARMMPTTYISHGGGPMPLLGQQPELSTFLKEYPQSLSTPTAIVVVSAHWITDKVTVSSGESHPLLFDYSGFPAETYKYTYPAPGSPALASQICDLLKAKNIPCAKDSKRGWDHGVFVPLKLMYPQADIPVVAMSLEAGLDPLKHIEIGQALAPLREQGVLIIGSGMSFHNFGYFFSRSSAEKERGSQHSATFDKVLVDNFTASPARSKEEQISMLVNWTQAPSGTQAHPVGQEEHLIPMHVAFGASVGDNVVDRDESPTSVTNKHFGFEMGGFKSSNFEFN